MGSLKELIAVYRQRISSIHEDMLQLLFSADLLQQAQQEQQQQQQLSLLLSLICRSSTT